MGSRSPYKKTASILSSGPDFVRSGNVNLNNGALRGYGESGWGWSRSAVAYGSATSANAYQLYFNPSVVNPSNGPNNRWNGFPVRLFCRGSVPIFFYLVLRLRAKNS